MQRYEYVTKILFNGKLYDSEEEANLAVKKFDLYQFLKREMSNDVGDDFWEEDMSPHWLVDKLIEDAELRKEFIELLGEQ